MIELECLVRAQHENVIELTSIFHKNDNSSEELCYSMPLIMSGDLINEILMQEFEENSFEKNEEFVYDTLIQVLKAMSFIHQGLQICHRDIKPQNILLDANDEVKLADFGVSKSLKSKLDTQTY